MPSVQPACSGSALMAANVAISSRGAAFVATTGLRYLWVDDMHVHLTPRTDPCSQRRKSLLIKSVCRVCCLNLCRGFPLLRTMWAELQPPRQKMLSLCWPWKAPRHAALGPALMMRLTSAAASGKKDAGVSKWPRSAPERQGAGATAARKPARRRRWRSSTGHAARFGRPSRGRC